MAEKSTAQIMIDIRDMDAGYENEPVLENINFTVYEADFIGLIGPNGGGKTTLIKVLLGLIIPSRGCVSIKGLPVAEGRRYLGYVPQVVEFDRQFPISVWDVVQSGRLGKRGLLHPYNQADKQIVESALRNVEMLDFCKKPVGELSGGQRQRVYIARALASEPEVLILDEPTSNVDPQVSSSIFSLLNKLNEKITIMMITHDMSAVSSYTKTVGCINRHLHYHGGKELTAEMIEATYQCPVDLIAHGLPHRVFPSHEDDSQ
jgi:zinc transport system ATP-binding protein